MNSRRSLSKIIENMINLNKENIGIGAYGENIESITPYWEMIKTGQLSSTGSGVFKTCYRNGDIAILHEKIYSNNPLKILNALDDEKKLIDILRTFGVQTPRYHNHACFVEETAKHIISTQDFVDGRVIYEFNNFKEQSSNFNEREQKFKAYNLETIKQRIALGEPFIPQFIDNFNILHPLNMLIDSHGKNIIFNPSTGYHYVDLNFTNIPEINNAHDVKNAIEKPVASDFLKAVNNQTYLGPDVSFKEQAKFLFCFSNLNRLSFSNMSDFFEYFVYNGMLAEQFENCVKKRIDLPENFDKGDRSPKYIFGMHEQDLYSLYEILKENNDERLEMFKFTFGLPKSYDLKQELDSEFFIREMERSIIPNLDNANINNP